MRVLTLSPQTLVDVTSVFALQGFKGPLIYDWFIGQHAVKHEIGTLVTWNIKHMHRLFPEIAVQTPSQFLETL